MSNQALPFEILLQIFEHLPKATLLQGAVVCKTWYQPATQLLFKNLELSSISPQKVLTLLSNQESKTNVGTLIRTLKFGRTSRRLTQEEFSQLITHMPFLKKIDLQELYYKFDYLDYLTKLSTEGCQYLENFDICQHVNQEEIRPYIIILYNCRRSLKTLNLFHIVKSFQVKVNCDQPDNSILYYLNEFENLTHLTIKNPVNNNGDPQLSIFYVLQSCPNLTHLNFDSEFYIPEENNMALITSSNIDVGSSSSLSRVDSTADIIQNFSSSSISSQPSSNQAHTIQQTLKKLQCVELFLKNITGIQLQRMLLYFPTNSLTNFKLHLRNVPSSVWINMFEKRGDLWNHFANYLGNVTNLVDISVLSYDLLRDYPLDPAVPSSLDVIDKYLPLADSIAGNRVLTQYHVRINIESLGRGNNRSSPSIIIRRKNSCMLLSYQVDSGEFDAHLQAEQQINHINILMPVPVKYEDEQRFGMINSLEIVLKDHDIVNSMFVNLLESAVNTFRRLNFITFSSTHNYHSRYRLSFGSDVNVCDLNSYPGYDLRSNYERRSIIDPAEDASITARGRMKCAVLSRVQVQPESITAITHILPHIKVLKSTECSLEQDSLHNTTIDITGIEHLEQLHLDITYIGNRRRYIFIKVDFTAENKISCFKAKCDGRVRSIPVFTPTTLKFLNDYNRFKSPHSSAVVIKCQKLDEIVVSYGKKDIKV